MENSTLKEMTPKELKDFIESIPEGTVVSIEVEAAEDEKK